MPSGPYLRGGCYDVPCWVLGATCHRTCDVACRARAQARAARGHGTTLERARACTRHTCVAVLHWHEHVDVARAFARCTQHVARSTWYVLPCPCCRCRKSASPLATFPCSKKRTSGSSRASVSRSSAATAPARSACCVCCRANSRPTAAPSGATPGLRVSRLEQDVPAAGRSHGLRRGRVRARRARLAGRGISPGGRRVSETHRRGGAGAARRAAAPARGT